MNLVFDIEALSQNDPIFGTNKGESRHLYKGFRNSIYSSLKSSLGPQNETERTAWKISRFWGTNKRQFDEANLIGGFKPIIDSMEKYHLIANDNPDFFKAYYFQSKSETGEGYIRIEKLDPNQEFQIALEKLAETFEVSKNSLLKVALQVGLIKE